VSRAVSADTGFACDRSAVIKDKIKETSSRINVLDY
jgi:hypothetical protein